MLLLIEILNILLSFFYAYLFLVYAFDFYWTRKVLGSVKRASLISIIGFHLLYIVLRTIEFNHAPITNKFELFTSIAFTVALAYFILEELTKERTTGFLIIIFSLIFQLLSSFFIENVYLVKDVLRNPLLGIHVISALLGHSLLIISAVYGALFIILYNRIKQHNYGTYFNRLPSLELLEKMSFKSLVAGYIILSFSIIIGAIWLPFAFPHFTHYDPKLISTIFIWIVYSFGIAAKKFFKWYGKKVIYLSIIGFFILIISMMIPLIFTHSFHYFR